MTLATAVAIRDTSGMTVVSTFSDSRLMLRGGVERSDYAIKSVVLGERTVVLMAGDTILPVVAATEIARVQIANLNASRQAEGRPPASLVVDSHIFLQGFFACCHAFRSVPCEIEVVVSGFFSDGAPGLIKIEYRDDAPSFKVFRPRLPGFAVVSIGQAAYASVTTRVVCEAMPRISNFQQLLERCAGVLAAVISHEGVPQVGGGLCIGYCGGDMPSWSWPAVCLDDVPFYRGVPINVVPASWKQTELQITTDSNAFAAAERDNQRDQHVSEFPAPIVLGVDYIVPGADVWSFDDDEASILGVRAI